jgi:hypothetical protein
MGAENSDTQGCRTVTNNAFSDIAEAFKRNVNFVYELAEFDHVVLAFAISVLERIEEAAQSKDSGITNYRLRVTKELQHLRLIRQNDSFRPKYQHIFNQCVVLLVSYFGSALRDLFSACVAQRLTSTRPPQQLLEEELKLSVEELLELSDDAQERVADMLMRKGDISFQDMQSTVKAFGKFCGHRPEKDQDSNNIILGQACRHVIVHSGAIVDSRCLSQVKSATPRALKSDLPEGHVQFSVEELKVLGSSMVAYVTKLIIALNSGELTV